MDKGKWPNDKYNYAVDDRVMVRVYTDAINEQERGHLQTSSEQYFGNHKGLRRTL